MQRPWHWRTGVAVSLSIRVVGDGVTARNTPAVARPQYGHPVPSLNQTMPKSAIDMIRNP
ncbi:hypothetical protein PUN4_760067 [Paraburkholderia unamae]|nr:hypothetical protein PUN4_760067 [Paraburkholderia unamae]